MAQVTLDCPDRRLIKDHHGRRDLRQPVRYTHCGVDSSKDFGSADRHASKKAVTSDDDAEVKRRLRLELAAQVGGDTVATEIGKRITALRSARSFVDWQKRRAFVKDLDLQRSMIIDRVAQTRADLALDLMWRFMDLAEPVINRVDDSNGSVGDVFRSACEDLGAIALRARPDPVRTGCSQRCWPTTTVSTTGW